MQKVCKSADYIQPWRQESVNNCQTIKVTVRAPSLLEEQTENFVAKIHQLHSLPQAS